MRCAANCKRSVQLHAGVFRTDEILSKGVREIMAIAERVKRTEIKDKSKVWNTARIEALELDNLIEVAKATWCLPKHVKNHAARMLQTTILSAMTKTG